MNDRDDYPDNPYRGRNERERGYDYDPLSDPLPAQPPSRGRRARPEPPARGDAPTAPDAADPGAGTGGFRRTGNSTGEFRTHGYASRADGEYDPLSPDAPPPGRRRRAEPPTEPPPGQPRRTGAADALRGGRAARSGANRSRGADEPGTGDRAQPQDPSRAHRGPAADPTQDALAALANLGAPSAPARPADEPARPRDRAADEPPPRRGRRSQAGSEPEPRRRRGAPVDEGSADTGAMPVEEEPAGRRGRRKRGRRDDEPTGGFLDDAPEDSGAFAPEGRSRTEGPADTGALPASEPPAGRRGGRRRRGAPVDEGSADTGAMPVEEEPAGRRGRRKRGRRDDEPTGGFLDDAPEDSGAFDSGSFPGLTGSADTGAFAAVPGPTRRRGARRARAERDEEETRGAARDPEPEEAASSGAFDEAEEASRSRRGGRRRRRGAPVEEAPPEADAAPDGEEDADPGTDAPEEEPESEPAGRRSRRRRGGDDGDGEPAGRRSRRRRGGRRAEEPEEEVEEYEEPALADIAEAYGGGRSSRRKAKELKRARANANRRGRGRRGMSKGLMIVLVLVLILVVGGGGYVVMRTYVFPEDFSGEGSGEVVFVIENGESGSAIAGNLADQGVVASSRAFVNALDAVPEDEIGDGLVPGTYSLAEGMSGEAAVAALLDPESRLGGQVTIREGLRNEQVLQELSDRTGVPLEELQAAHEQTDELGLPDYATEGSAGYLFPATYRFDPGTEAMSMLKTMVTHHRNVTEEMELEERAAGAGYDPNEIMAMASIIQAESGKAEDMPMISRVIYNRLDIGMNLGMDSTCFYAIGEYGIALNNDQLAQCEADTSGFDTYHKSGLPPGPFVAPGEDAIEAALEPAEGDWLYFVATDPENGVTEFASTEAEFNELKARFEETWGGGE
ncbi:endolytic transglycosylase MltG [Streptomonospora nanhaiensis]|uniref:Endolytic murein transglycosylase n=1 Tax=Streptomonospora nanhaiensis TaxID=1323731 RepID=A0ABY6YT35_9ACTN|nr:endolytic transglycosylase MltG [Streptomonospora nanhaiensis]WAE75161.1 endolytic transglycosylase MltG [Streptomonospora nanhaiensis]